MRPLFAIRPEPGLAETCAGARALGLEIHGQPLFAVEPLAWVAPEPSAVDGLLIGSANVFAYGGAGLAGLRRLPVHAVGARTSDAARGSGFAVAATGEAGLQALLDTLKPPLRLLRLAGEKHVALTPPAGIAIDTLAVYRAVPQPMPGEFAARLSRGGVVLIHSGEAAAHFDAECRRTGVRRPALWLAVLAPRILERTGTGWAATAAARSPADPALLALASDMCQ